ncbi:LexA family transcriptional regulator [Acidovorax sp. LjRoot74]|uniref:S24 family peptidase n=1 Tax=Acidovorax sp. LjRoot74 TaxID=3342337 RepID=UPI003ECDBB6C
MSTDQIAQEEGARLALLLGARSKAQFARDFGVPGGPSMVSQHLSGHRPISLKAAVAYARGLGVPVEAFSPRLALQINSVLPIPEGSYIDDGTTPAPIDLENNPEYPAIRRVEFKLSAGASGFGVEYRDSDGAPMVFQRKWYTDNGFEPGHLFAVRVANGSMEPGLYDGDTVVVNTKSTQPKDGIVFAVNYEGEMVIKRLIRDGGQWWLSSDNPNQQRYPRKLCDEHSRLIGEVVHKQSMRI